MSIRPHLAILAAIILGVVASVAVSQPPQIPSSEGFGKELGGNWESKPGGLSVPARPTAQMGAAGDMIGFSHDDGVGTQTITLVDTKKSWMAVYHIDRSGKIRLVSSRPIDADFSLQLNATSPLPEEIRRFGKR